MALVGRNPSQDGQVRHLQELVRRDETRLPTGDAVGAWQSATPYLNTGWIPLSSYPGYPAPRYYIDRERAYLIGEVYYDAGIGGPGDETFPIIMPAGAHPAHRADVTIHSVPNGTVPGNEDLFWFAFILNNGMVLLEQNPDPRLTASSGFPPDQTWLFFDFSYRVT